MKKTIFFAFFILMSLNHVLAQTKHETSGWLMLVNSTKLNEKWGVHFDAQFRSGDNFAYLKNILIRPGITYHFNKNNNVTLGYLLNQTYFKGDVTQVAGGMAFKDPLNEHRIWEQYVLNHKLSSIFATQRFRLEQRFIENNGTADAFAQRFRYFFRFIKPLQKTQETFDKGAFIALQNEVFVNVQNNQKVNGSFFDQNRAYLAFGYRFSKKADLEAGYLNQTVNGRTSNTNNNVIQLAVYTRF